MEKKYFTTVIFILICFLGAEAQIDLTSKQGATIMRTWNLEPRHVDIIDGVSKMHYSSSLASFIGSPYLDDNFKKGTMKAIEGTVIPDLRYRYDIYADRMEFIVSEDTVYIDLPLALEYVQIGDRKFQYEVFMLIRDMVATGYFEILYEGDFISAMLQRRIKLEQDAYVTNYGGGGGTKDFIMKREKHFFVKQRGSAARMIERKKDLYRILPEYQRQLHTFMKENRISLRQEDDFYRVVEYMDRLVKGV